MRVSYHRQRRIRWRRQRHRARRFTFGSLDAVWCEFGDEVRLDINDTDAVAVSVLVVPSVTQRPLAGEFSRTRLASFLWVFECLADLFLDELGSSLVTLLVDNDVAKRPQHEAEAGALVSSAFKEVLTLL